MLFRLLFQEPPPEHDPSKLEQIFSVLGILAEGMSDLAKIPVYLAWIIIIWVLLTFVYILILTVEKFLGWFRWILIFGWGILTVTVILILQILT